MKLDVPNDDLFFHETHLRHAASLLLPELPSSLETRFEPGDGSGTMTVELELYPEDDTGVVTLIGNEPERIEALWEEARGNGGWSLPDGPAVAARCRGTRRGGRRRRGVSRHAEMVPVRPGRRGDRQRRG